jgi:hypothetical protein
MSKNPLKYLGPVFIGSTGTPVGKFEFILKQNINNVKIEIGTPVTAETDEGTFIGIINDLKTVGTDGDAVSIETGTVEPAKKTAMVASVQVFHSPAMRSVRPGLVRAATAEEVGRATGIDKINWPIPAGVIPLAEGGYARVVLDGANLIGPEASHLCIGGLSGQAAKTSFAGVLLKSALEAGKASGRSVAALVINVKGDDLVNLGSPPTERYALTESDFAMYAAMGISPTPFENVTVYAPALPGSSSETGRYMGPLTASSNPNAKPLRWDLNMVWDYLGYFFPEMYEDEKLSAFFSEFRKFKLRPDRGDAESAINTFNGFVRWIDEMILLAEGEGTSTPWRYHHVMTLGRIRRMVGSLPARCNGLLVGGKADSVTDDMPLAGLMAGDVMVLDVANLGTDVQSVVIARTCEKILRNAEKSLLGVDHLIIFIDELNNFAPSQGRDMAAIKRILRQITSQGRYANVSLWGAAQKLSKIDEMIRDNAATRALGITTDGELASGIYGQLPRGLSERLATLEKGQMALWHSSFRSALVVKFPRPAWQTGRSEERGNGALDTLGLSTASLANLTEGLTSEHVAELISGTQTQEEMKEKLLSARTPDVRRVILSRPATVDIEDPFGLGLVEPTETEDGTDIFDID